MMGKILSLPLLALLMLYKFLISPILQAVGVRCRHEPSCSTYSTVAIRRHGPWYGSWMTLARLQRCHPWGTCGVDNVPEEITTPPLWAPWRVGRWRKTHLE